MDSPVRQYQKQKDYQRHKLFRKIRRRRKAEAQQAIDAPMKELMRRLKRYDGGKNVEEEQPVISGQQPDMSWHKYWLNNRADILGHNIKDTEIHPIWALQELTDYNFPGFEKIGKERIKEELNNAQKFREYTSPNEMPEKAIQFLHRNLPLGITDQQAYDAKMGGNAGVTYPYQNIVMYHPFSTNVARGHERTHTLNATAQEKKVKQIMMDQYKDRSWFDDYYEDPSEIYARLMNFRYMAKLNPKKKVTVEDLEKWRSDFDLNYGVYAPADNLLRRYNNDTLLRLFNEVAQNNTENVLNEDGLLMANSGKDPDDKNTTLRTVKNVASFLPFIGTAIDGYDVIANGQYDKAPQFLLGLAGDTLGFGAAAKAYKAQKAYKALRTAKILAPNSISTPALYKAMRASNKAVNRGIAAAATDVVSHAENVADIVDYNSGKDSGIRIKPKNRGKFNALKKRTGKTTEQLTHSKNPLTRKRAIFAQNARKWHHK